MIENELYIFNTRRPKAFDTDVILSARMISAAYAGREKDDNRYAMARQTSWKMTAAITFFDLNEISPQVINVCISSRFLFYVIDSSSINDIH